MVVPVERQTGGADIGPALQDDVGREGIVARSHSRIAPDPVARFQFCRVRTGGADASDAPGAGDDRKLQHVGARAVEHAVGVAGDAGGGDVDHDIAGAGCGVGQRLDGERRGVTFENCGLHGDLGKWVTGR